jgi:hypothetical protein
VDRVELAACMHSGSWCAADVCFGRRRGCKSVQHRRAVPKLRGGDAANGPRRRSDRAGFGRLRSGHDHAVGIDHRAAGHLRRRVRLRRVWHHDQRRRHQRAPARPFDKRAGR